MYDEKDVIIKYVRYIEKYGIPFYLEKSPDFLFYEKEKIYQSEKHIFLNKIGIYNEGDRYFVTENVS